MKTTLTIDEEELYPGVTTSIYATIMMLNK